MVFCLRLFNRNFRVVAFGERAIHSGRDDSLSSRDAVIEGERANPKEMCADSRALGRKEEVQA